MCWCWYLYVDLKKKKLLPFRFSDKGKLKILLYTKGWKSEDADLVV